MTKSESQVEQKEEVDKAQQFSLDKTSWSPILLVIRFYQKFISPLIGNNCRFTPTCSHYMVEAITQFGHVKGAYLGTKRICKCHPWHPGGYDPVPKE